MDNTCRLLLFLVSFCLFSGCAAKKIEDISYLNSTNLSHREAKLNIFIPRKASEEKLSVLIFVHGGNWNSGNKGQYGFFGRNFAKKGVITIIPDYTLSPAVSYDEMTQQIAEAINWAKANISHYNGDADRVYLTGHSAGGHLVALAAMNPKYHISPNDISGIILNDAAGLDMYNYLKKDPPKTDNNYLTTWTDNPEIWKAASPIYFIDENTPPIMMYLGSKTYASIKEGNRRFLNELHNFQPNVEPIVLNKKHVPMIVQYFWPWSKRFNEVLKFISSTSPN